MTHCCYSPPCPALHADWSAAGSQLPSAFSAAAGAKWALASDSQIVWLIVSFPKKLAQRHFLKPFQYIRQSRCDACAPSWVRFLALPHMFVFIGGFLRVRPGGRLRWLGRKWTSNQVTLVIVRMTRIMRRLLKDTQKRPGKRATTAGRWRWWWWRYELTGGDHW